MEYIRIFFFFDKNCGKMSIEKTRVWELGYFRDFENFSKKQKKTKKIIKGIKKFFKWKSEINSQKGKTIFQLPNNPIKFQ